MTLRNAPQVSFLGLEGDSATKSPRFGILPVPMEMTTTYGQGTGKGPRAILEASENLELYDDELDCEPWRVGIRTLDYLPIIAANPQAMITQITEAVQAITTEKMVPLLLGGEHTVTVGGVAGVLATDPTVSVVSFDAHADYRSSYQGQHYSHACTLRRVSEMVKVINVGVRSLSVVESQEIKLQDRYAMIRAAVVPETSKVLEQILAHCPGSLYITIDLDVLDPAIMPAVGTPEPGGLSWWQLGAIIKGLCRQRHVVGADIVELAPIPGLAAPNFLAAKLLYKLIGYMTNLDRIGSFSSTVNE